MTVILEKPNKTKETYPNKTKETHPWYYIPTLYFGEGLPYVLVNSVSVIIYKNMGVSNGEITFWTSLLYLPWVIKMFWGPIVEVYSSKRNWILWTQLGMMLCLILTAFSLHLNHFFFISLFFFTVAAFISATHDIAADGFYLLALNPLQQAYFAGIRSVFYRIALIFGSGLLVVFAGKLATQFNNIPLSWSMALGGSGLIFGAIFLYHLKILPFPSTIPPLGICTLATLRGVETLALSLLWVMFLQKRAPFYDIAVSYFRQRKIVAIIAFILLYRFGEALLLKVSPLFLLDPLEKGGLGLTIEDVGYIMGTYGMLAVIIGGILGGVIIAKYRPIYGLRKVIIPLALALHLPDILYVYMAIAKPPLNVVYLLVSLEQFGYGLGLTAFMVYLMEVGEEKYKTSHYAISTGIMALGMMVPGLVSGYLQEAMGYIHFFTLVCFLAIPGILPVFYIPIKDKV